MFIYDTHCHIQFSQYDSDRDALISATLGEKIRMICIGTDPESSQKALELARANDGIWGTVGVHPNDAGLGLNLEKIRSLISDPKTVAIGEVGLDFYRTTEPEKQSLQKEVLKKFFELAVEFRKPLVIHCRDAHSELWKIISKTFNNTGQKSNQAYVPKIVIHSFTGTWVEAQQYIEAGFYIGMNGIITFTDQYDETVINTPLEKILLETDSPYLTPAPNRGKRNEPANIIEVAKRISQVKGVSLEEVLLKTSQNSEEFFGISSNVY